MTIEIIPLLVLPGLQYSLDALGDGFKCALRLSEHAAPNVWLGDISLGGSR